MKLGNIFLKNVVIVIEKINLNKANKTKLQNIQNVIY